MCERVYKKEFYKVLSGILCNFRFLMYDFSCVREYIKRNFIGYFLVYCATLYF